MVKKSSYVHKSFELVTSIFHHHCDSFFSNDVNKKYFIFLRDIITKISQCDFNGPRFLATNFGRFCYKISLKTISVLNFKL